MYEKDHRTRGGLHIFLFTCLEIWKNWNHSTLWCRFLYTWKMVPLDPSTDLADLMSRFVDFGIHWESSMNLFSTKSWCCQIMPLCKEFFFLTKLFAKNWFLMFLLFLWSFFLSPFLFCLYTGGCLKNCCCCGNKWFEVFFFISSVLADKDCSWCSFKSQAYRTAIWDAFFVKVVAFNTETWLH